MSAFDLPGAAASRPDNANASTTGNPDLLNSAEGIDLSGLSMMGLLALRSRVHSLLPAVHLKDMDLSQELVLQVAALQELQRLTMGAEEVPANQQAQVANSLSAALVNLVKLQGDVHTSERLKKIERILIESIQELPTDAQQRFLDAYQKGLEAVL